MAVLGDTRDGSTIQGNGVPLKWALGFVVAVVATTVVVGGWLAIRQDAPEAVSQNTPRALPESGSGSESILTADEVIMIRLATAGIIPMAAVDWDTIELKRAVARGFVPELALHKAEANADPLYSSEELATIDLANRGLIPNQSVDWELAELKDLANRGLIPRAAAR